MFVFISTGTGVVLVQYYLPTKTRTKWWFTQLIIKNAQATNEWLDLTFYIFRQNLMHRLQHLSETGCWSEVAIKAGEPSSILVVPIVYSRFLESWGPHHKSPTQNPQYMTITIQKEHFRIRIRFAHCKQSLMAISFEVSWHESKYRFRMSLWEI